MLIPISGKPGELDVDNIKTPGDADRVLLWLATVLKDMDTQVKDRADPDSEWLRKLRAAQRATNNLFHRVLERRDNFTGEIAVHQAVAIAVASTLDEESLARVARYVEKNFPHLAAMDITALAKDQQA